LSKKSSFDLILNSAKFIMDFTQKMLVFLLKIFDILKRFY